MLPFNLHPTLIWAIAFCCLCVTVRLSGLTLNRSSVFLKTFFLPTRCTSAPFDHISKESRDRSHSLPQVYHSQISPQQKVSPRIKLWKHKQIQDSPSAVHNSAVTIFVIDVEAAKMGQDHVLQGSPATLNMEAILKSQKVKPFDSASSELTQSDSLTNLLLCDEKSDSLRF